MSTALQKLKDIDKNTKYAVSGYIRKQHKSELLNISPFLLFQNVPIFISALCTLYYYSSDYFDCIGKNVLVSNNNKVLTYTRDGLCIKYNSSYGHIIIRSNDSCTYKWKFRFSKTIDDYHRFIIGIASTSITSTNDVFWRTNNGQKFYCFSPWYGTIKSHSLGTFITIVNAHKWSRTVWKQEIGLELDVKKRKLICKYDESGKATKIVVFDDIEIGDNTVDYRLAVSLTGKDFEFSIVEFQQ